VFVGTRYRAVLDIGRVRPDTKFHFGRSRYRAGPITRPQCTLHIFQKIKLSFTGELQIELARGCKARNRFQFRDRQ